MFTVFVSGLEVYAYHGANAPEREVGHRFVVDIEVEVDGDAIVTDRVADTVDYGALTELAHRALSEGPYHTVERGAQLIADAILARFVHAQGVTVTIAKRLPPIAATVDLAGVKVSLRRES
ncbi:MAG TPA: dihydroneopterin aldolase [Fimbriimonadaceae bacterium]|nr:dihydroneopterin aldolase [Fimbriimonadaceae bacterium]